MQLGVRKDIKLPNPAERSRVSRSKAVGVEIEEKGEHEEMLELMKQATVEHNPWGMFSDEDDQVSVTEDYTDQDDCRKSNVKVC